MNDRFDDFIKENLNSELDSLKMLASLKNEIKLKTIKKKRGILENINIFLNKTVEINLTSVAAVFMVFFIGAYSTFTIALNREAQNEIKGYGDYKVITIDGVNVVVENDNEKVSLVEKN